MTVTHLFTEFTDGEGYFVNAGVYSDGGSVPDALLAAATPQVMTSPGRLAFILASPRILAAGTYWLAVKCSGTGDFNLSSDPLQPGPAYATLDAWNDGAFPASAPYEDVGNGYRLSILASSCGDYPVDVTLTPTRTPTITATPTVTPTDTTTATPTFYCQVGWKTTPQYEYGAGTLTGYALGTSHSIPWDADVYSLVVYVPAGVTDLRAALYADDGSGTKAKDRMLEVGPVQAGTGWNLLTVPGVRVTAGLYWLTFQVQNGSYAQSTVFGQDYGFAPLAFGAFPADLAATWSSSQHTAYAAYMDLCPVSTFTPTVTWTPSFTPTNSPTQTATDTPTDSPTSSPTRTSTVTMTPTVTLTPTETYCLPPTGSSAVFNSTGTPQAIPDYTAISSSMVVTGAPDPLAEVNVSVDITHTYRGDLIVWVQSPEGRSVTLHNRSGVDADDLITTYDTLTAPLSPLAVFNCRTANGTWTLWVKDDYPLQDYGTLNSWSLELR